MTDKKNKQFTLIGDILKNYQADDTDKYISREFQKYGYNLAEELGDLEHKALYIKLAKEEKRGLLEVARRFVSDAKDVESKGKLYMWKLKQLKDEDKRKKKGKGK